ncbi:MAG TPA: hypothetical protein VIP77_15600 [Jiangellaceae bacterium]
MIDTFEDLTTVILVLNALTGGWLLPVVALLLLVIVTCGVWEMSSRSRRARPSRRPRRPSVEEMADPSYNPALDCTEQEGRTLRDALSAEADALADFWETREDRR